MCFEILKDFHDKKLCLPHLEPLRTCPLSHKRRTKRTWGGFEASKTKEIPLILRFTSVLLNFNNRLLEISSVVWLRSAAVVFSGSGTFKSKLMESEILDESWLLPKSLFRSVPVWSPHSTSTFSIVHSPSESQSLSSPK